MSIAIDITRIEAVLLADGWHKVVGKFDIDSYEYLWSGMGDMSLEDLEEKNRTRDYKVEQHRDPMIVHGGGESGVCASGFVFETEDGTQMAGPLTAVLAVRFRRGD